MSEPATLAPPESNESTSLLWIFYLSETIQETADSFFQPERIVDFIEAAQARQKPAALEVVGKNPRDYLEVILRGECFDGPAQFRASLYKDDLTAEQRLQVLKAIRRHYSASSGPQWDLILKIARVLGVTPGTISR